MKPNPRPREHATHFAPLRYAKRYAFRSAATDKRKEREVDRQLRGQMSNGSLRRRRRNDATLNIAPLAAYATSRFLSRLFRLAAANGGKDTVAATRRNGGKKRLPRRSRPAHASGRRPAADFDGAGSHQRDGHKTRAGGGGGEIAGGARANFHPPTPRCHGGRRPRKKPDIDNAQDINGVESNGV